MTRLIVLAAAEGEGFDLILVSPIREGQENTKHASEKVRNLRDSAFYALTRKVADIIFEYVTTVPGDSSRDKPYKEDRRKEGANPYYNQTSEGLYLELYYGTPSSLWTPWGKWNFGGSGGGSWNSILPSLIERFGATLYQPLRRSKMGEFGPVYALHKVDDTPLPDPVELKNSAYVSYKDLNAVWEELTKQYKSA